MPRLHIIMTPIAFLALCAGAFLEHKLLLAIATVYYSGLIVVILLLGILYACKFARKDAAEQQAMAYRFCHTVTPKTYHWALGLAVTLLFTYAGQFGLPLAMSVTMALILAARQHMKQVAMIDATDP